MDDGAVMADFTSTILPYNSAPAAVGFEAASEGSMPIKALFLRNTYVPNSAHASLADLNLGTHESTDPTRGVPSGGVALSYSSALVGNEFRIIPVNLDLSSTILLSFRHVVLYVGKVSPDDRLIGCYISQSPADIPFENGVTLQLPSTGIYRIGPTFTV